MEDVDARVRQAVDAGAKQVRPTEDKFYGDRLGTVEDPYGHQRHLSTHIEDASVEEIQERFEAYMQQRGA